MDKEGEGQGENIARKAYGRENKARGEKARVRE